MSRKGLGNEACPKWNPQAEFISAEEKPRFQGFAEQILHEEIGLYSSVLTRQNPIGALPPASGFAAMDFDEGCRLCRHPQAPLKRGFSSAISYSLCPYFFNAIPITITTANRII